MKAVLISIQPKWCEFIASGKKTIEIRKTKPKLETPFKVYIYCTKDKERSFFPPLKKLNFKPENYVEYVRGNGKVIGEFVCDEIIELAPINRADEDIEKHTCLSRERIVEYLRGKGYGWHISDLVIYDNPKELSEFRSFYPKAYFDEELRLPMPTHEITKPPQSWCYVERSDNNAGK